MTNLCNAPLVAAILAIAATVIAPARAGEAQDRIFRVGLLDGIEVGETLVFARERAGIDGAEAAPPIEDGEIGVAVIEETDGRRLAQVEVRTPGQATSRTQLPADGGHPVLLVFLETTAADDGRCDRRQPVLHSQPNARGARRRRAARAGRGHDSPADDQRREAATFRPFDDDPNRAKMGAFARSRADDHAERRGARRLRAVRGRPARARRAAGLREAIAFEPHRGCE